jgi:hypothetical protein
MMRRIFNNIREGKAVPEGDSEGAEGARNDSSESDGDESEDNQQLMRGRAIQNSMTRVMMKKWLKELKRCLLRLKQGRCGALIQSSKEGSSSS